MIVNYYTTAMSKSKDAINLIITHADWLTEWGTLRVHRSERAREIGTLRAGMLNFHFIKDKHKLTKFYACKVRTSSSPVRERDRERRRERESGIEREREGERDRERDVENGYWICLIGFNKDSFTSAHLLHRSEREREEEGGREREKEGERERERETDGNVEYGYWIYFIGFNNGSFTN